MNSGPKENRRGVQTPVRELPGRGGTETVKVVKSGVYNYDENIVSVKVAEFHDSTNSESCVRVVVLAAGVTDYVIAQAVLDSRTGGHQSFDTSTGTGTINDGTVET